MTSNPKQRIKKTNEKFHLTAIVGFTVFPNRSLATSEAADETQIGKSTTNDC
jgi:hypothetical protein